MLHFLLFLAIVFGQGEAPKCKCGDGNCPITCCKGGEECSCA